MAEELKVDEGTLLEAQGELVEGRPHREALMLGFTAFVFPDGTKWNVTYREGTKSKPALEFAVTLHTISTGIIKMGGVPQGVPWPPRNIAEEQEKQIAEKAEMRAHDLLQEQADRVTAQVTGDAKAIIQNQVAIAVTKVLKETVATFAVSAGLMRTTKDGAGGARVVQIGEDAGLTRDDMVDKFSEWIAALNAVVVPVQQPKHPPTKKAKQPQSQPEQAPEGDGQIEFVQVKVVAKEDGSPIIGFWNPGRDYAEIRYHRSAELLLEMADQGFRDAFDEADLEQIGMAAPFTGIVHYVLSENTDTKGRPYKNISFIETT